MENQDMEDGVQAKKNYGRILTTPEAIVREHRKHWETIHHVNFKSQDHQGPVGGLSKTKNHRAGTFELIIWTLVIGCLAYLTIRAFVPFILKNFF